MSQTEIRQNLRHNFVVNVLDGCFFGFGLVGLASYVTIIPLFMSYLTDSTALIGFMATMFTIGWQVPQLLTANRVASLRRFKPMALFMTLHERVPYFGLAIVAFLVPTIGKQAALILTILLLFWQSFGGGFTATAWQSLISKIMPPNRRGTFFGIQSSGANLFASAGALASSVILAAFAFPNNFGVLFLIAGVSLMVSFAFLAWTREPDSDPADIVEAVSISQFWERMKVILRRDLNFRWFILARTLSAINITALSFFTIYALRVYNMPPEMAGTLTSLMLATQTLTSPLAGYIGDKWGHRSVYAVGNLLMVVAIIIAIIAPDLSWFYIVFVLAGAVNSTLWGPIMAITAEFGTVAERPIYIGMANTFIAPATIFAPIVGGILADSLGFGVTFGISIVAGVLSVFVLLALMYDPLQAKLKNDGIIVAATD